MNDRFTESELLAFVEDELDAATRITLEARLADDPGLRGQLTGMREDRTVLRGTPEPALPVDFIAALEPQLARPMLMQGQPGAYRRRHQLAARRARQLRTAVAAGLLIALGAGLWGSAMLVTGWIGDGAGPDLVRGPSRLPADPTSPRDIDSANAPLASSEPPPDPVAPPPGVIVHHLAPLPGVVDGALPSVASVPASSILGDRASDAIASPIVAGFAVVLAAGPNDHAAEDRLVAAMQDSDGPTDAALVRNFSMAEAGSLIRELQARGIQDAGTPEVFSGVGGVARARKAGWKRVADVLRRLNRGAVPEVDARRRSGLLAGSEDVAPSYEDQLELSSRGATHTVTLRVDQLATLVERLHPVHADDAPTTLRPLPEVATTIETDELAAFRVVQAEMRRLADLPPGTPVMLPIVIE